MGVNSEERTAPTCQPLPSRLGMAHVQAVEAVKAPLGRALAVLCTEAGWSCYDSGVAGMGYFTRALRVAYHNPRST